MRRDQSLAPLISISLTDAWRARQLVSSPSASTLRVNVTFLQRGLTQGPGFTLASIWSLKVGIHTTAPLSNVVRSLGISNLEYCSSELPSAPDQIAVNSSACIGKNRLICRPAEYILSNPSLQPCTPRLGLLPSMHDHPPTLPAYAIQRMQAITATLFVSLKLNELFQRSDPSRQTHRAMSGVGGCQQILLIG